MPAGSPPSPPTAPTPQTAVADGTDGTDPTGAGDRTGTNRGTDIEGGSGIGGGTGTGADADGLTGTCCARCGAPFPCGARAAQCGCSALPALEPLPADLGPHCLCPRCLRAALDACARTTTC